MFTLRGAFLPTCPPALEPRFEIMEALTDRIWVLENRVHELCRSKYPATALLTQIHGVAELTALTFLLAIEDPLRLRRNPDVGAYLGPVSGQHQSGASNPNRRITKAGEEDLRRLLVQCSHHILSKRDIDSDFKRHGERIAPAGTKEAKPRELVAAARKPAIVL